MRISAVGTFGNSPRRDLGFVRAYAETMEGLGFHSLVVPEHVVFFGSYESKYPYTEDGSANWSPDTGIFDPLFVVAAAAGVTTTLKFCTGVLILPQRPALLTAKEVLTLDHFSQGRFELGVGGGWSSEEYAALGVPWERRGRRFDEYLEAIKAAWTQDRASYHGEFVDFDDVVLNPKPFTPGGPPIIVGGESTAAMRRAARLGDGWYGWWASGALAPHLDTLRAVVAEEGRSVDDDDFDLKVGLPIGTETVDELAAKIEVVRSLGADECVLAGLVPTAAMEATLAGYADVAGLA
ncbi:MAG: LLM class F420-dependent oxidoreductase [Acidimicrobiales bacterium]